MATAFAYEQYFGLREHPFSITPDPRFVYLSDMHRTALEHLESGATGGVNGFVLLTGDVGTGKTTICRTFLEKLPPRTEVALILNPVLTLNEFLQAICDELDLVVEGSRKSNKNLIDQLNRFLLQVYAVGQKTILIVDEAQNLSQELLEQIRLLTNLETATDKLLQIFLIGQPELRDMLNRPEMAQVSQRITSRYHLGPLNLADTEKYILRRLEVAGAPELEFTASAMRRIHQFSKGVPRIINVLCDKVLATAYDMDTPKIGPKVVKEAEGRVIGNLPTTSPSERRRSGAALAAFSLAGIVFILVAVLVADLGGFRSWINEQIAGAPPAAPAITQPDALAKASPSPDEPVLDPLAGAAAVETSDPVSQASSTGVALAPSTGQVPSGLSQPVQDAKAPAIAAQEPAPQRTDAITEDGEQVAARQSEEPVMAPSPAPTELASVQTPAAPSESARPSAPKPAEPLEPVASAQQAAGREADPAPPPAAPPFASAVPAPAPPSAGDKSARQTREARSRPRAGSAEQSLSDYTRSYAERKLLSMWGVGETQSVGLDFCRTADSLGMRCLNEGSGLRGLYLYDRPAIIFLTIDQVSSYAVVLKASADRVVLDVLGQEHVISAGSLNDVWDGTFLLLWKPPSNVASLVQEGVSGPSALWLRRAIDRIEGVQTTGAVFDSQLTSRVRQFQRTVGLSPDGIVGPRTFILLQNKLAESRG